MQNGFGVNRDSEVLRPRSLHQLRGDGHITAKQEQVFLHSLGIILSSSRPISPPIPIRRSQTKMSSPNIHLPEQNHIPGRQPGKEPQRLGAEPGQVEHKGVLTVQDRSGLGVDLSVREQQRDDSVAGEISDPVDGSVDADGAPEQGAVVEGEGADQEIAVDFGPDFRGEAEKGRERHFALWNRKKGAGW